MSDQKKQGKKKGGSAKYGRNNKSPNLAESLYVKGKISFEQYQKMKKG